MKNFFLTVTLLLSPAAALASPTSNKLIQPYRVTALPSGKVQVTYSLPCESDDSVAFVMNYDDSGDQVVAVGVVYSENVCKPGRTRLFSREVDPKAFGISDAVFEPMDVAGAASPLMEVSGNLIPGWHDDRLRTGCSDSTFDRSDVKNAQRCCKYGYHEHANRSICGHKGGCRGIPHLSCNWKNGY